MAFVKNAEETSLKKFFALLFITLILCSCGSESAVNSLPDEKNKLSIITTLFPQYDFVRQIAGNKVNVTLLLPPGTNSHIFEPNPHDIIKINNADLFVYTGDTMETWAGKIIKGLDKNVDILDLSEKIPFDENEEEEEHDGHVHTIDPHFFTNLKFSQLAVREITAVLCEKDSENSSFYEKNADEYIEKLESLDQSFRAAIYEGSKKEIVFGGRFAFHYFTEEYGISYISAYDGCGTGAEPSIKRISEIVSAVKENDIKVIYYEELVDPKIAKSIAGQTGTEIMLMHTCHNISKEDFDNGKTYLDFMTNNLEVLKEGLK